MAEGRGDDDSSVDSLSDEESRALPYFNLPNDWLWCPPDIDPMSREDLSEIFTASQRFGHSSSSYSSVNIQSTEAKGEVFDSRTFTRPKKQHPNTVNHGLLQTSHQNSKLTRILKQSTTDEENKYVKTANNLTINHSEINTTVIENNSLNSNLNFASPSLRTLLFSDITLLENISHPSTLFINLSHINNTNDTIKVTNSGSNGSESIYHTALSMSTPYSDIEKIIKNNKTFSKKKSIESFDFVSPVQRSTPITIISKNPFRLKKNKMIQYSKKNQFCNFDKTHDLVTSLNSTYYLPRTWEIAGGDIHEADNMNDHVTATSQIISNEEEVIIKSEDTSHEEYNLTPRILRKLNETFTSKNDSNPCKKNDFSVGNNRTLLENISIPSGFLSNLSLSHVDLIQENNGISIERTSRVNERTDIKNLKSLKDKSLIKEVYSDCNIPLDSTPSHEKDLHKYVSFNPEFLSTPKNQGSPHIKGKAYIDVQALENINCANNNIITNINEQCKSIMSNKSVININLGENGVCLNEVVINNIIPNNSDKDNTNYLVDKEFYMCTATSVENMSKNLKVNKDKDEDSAPDSCYSSSSNIRSTGDVCGIVQHENMNYHPSMRKSISHESLLLHETYKTSSSQFKKHVSELNLIPVASLKGGKRGEKVISDSKYLGATSKAIRGSRTLQKPKFYIRSSDFENINPNETFCVDEEKDSKPSLLKAPTEFSKIPIPRKTRIPVFQNRRHR